MIYFYCQSARTSWMLWQQGAIVVAEPSYIESPQSGRMRALLFLLKRLKR